MNIAVCMASRGRPLLLTAAIVGLWRLRSTQHDIAFLVGVDEDDKETIATCERMAAEFPITHHIFERPKCLGEIHNALLPSCEGADFVSTWNDRNQCLTLGWDEGIVQSNNQKPDRVLWWSSPQDPGCTMPIWPASYLKAANYRWTPEIFPFWFDDTWLMQVDRLAFGGPALKAPVYYCTERGKTTRGRDFAFWGDVFSRTLPARIAEAQELCKALNLEWKDRPELIEEFDREATFFSENAERFEAQFGDEKEATPEYLAAKAAASEFLKEAA